MQALSLVTHHDAITGTSTRAVTEDFMDSVVKGVNEASKVISEVIKEVHPDPGTRFRSRFCRVLVVLLQLLFV